MSKGGTSIKDALKAFETAKGVVATETAKIELWGRVPPIDKMDATLGTLKACTHLALSTNNIAKIAFLNGMEKLEILSLARNLISRIEGLEPVAGTLQQLWLSYNNILSLSGLSVAVNLKVLYLANNVIRDYKELDNVPASLEELSLVGCPLFEAAKGEKGDPAAPLVPGNPYRLDVLIRVPNLKKLDGVPVDAEERDAARAKAAATSSGLGSTMKSGLGDTLKPKTPSGDAA